MVAILKIMLQKTPKKCDLMLMILMWLSVYSIDLSVCFYHLADFFMDHI